MKTLEATLLDSRPTPTPTPDCHASLPALQSPYGRNSRHADAAVRERDAPVLRVALGTGLSSAT